MGDVGLGAEKDHGDDDDDNDNDDNEDDDDEEEEEIPVAVLTRADNHRPCRERLRAKTLKTSLSSRALSSCSGKQYHQYHYHNQISILLS